MKKKKCKKFKNYKSLFFACLAILIVVVLTFIIKKINNNSLEKTKSNYNYTQIDNFVCDAFLATGHQIYIATDEYFVMKNSLYDDSLYYIYQYNYPLLYDNDSNCRALAVKEQPVIGFGHESYDGLDYIVYGDFSYNVLTKQGLSNNIYRYSSNSSYVIDTKMITNYQFVYYNQYLKPKSNISYNLVITDKNIYKDIYSKNGPTSIFEINNPGEVITRFFQNSIITTESVYLYEIVDPKCKKYLSNKCKYDFIKNDELTKIKDDIFLINSEYVILKDGTIYKYEYVIK